MNMIIGIDLGTSTTEAAVYRNGAVEMIPNSDGQIVTPSAIGIDDEGEIVLGEKARSQYVVYPERTAIEVKRKLGTDARIHLGEKAYTPVELSSMLLSYIRSCASEYLGEDVTRAVISVPAYFNDIQRQEVIQAGKAAGFTVERLIHEPTAAALSYGITHMDEESHILVYDLGGGTFDITLLEMFDGVLEVKASSGDNQLGGKDFDECLCQYLMRRFNENTGLSLKRDPYALARLKEQAEQCKIALSSVETFTIRLPVLAKKDHTPVGLEETITREQFEQMIEEYVERTHTPIYTALTDGDVSLEDLDRVLLVGGSTRIPLVSKDLETLLQQPPATAIHPEYSVAEGAAIQAAIIDGKMDPQNRLVVTDVNPFSLGISAVTDFTSDYMSVVIPRNTTIPVTRKEIYRTYGDKQTQAHIRVYQGESLTASENHFLGDFLLDGIPPAKAGKESLEIAFSYDLNGILKIEATILSTRKSGNLTVNMLAAKPDTRINVDSWKLSPCAGPFRAIIRRGERLLKKLDADDPDYEDIEELLYQLKKAIILEDEDQAEQIEDQLRDQIEER